MTARPEILTHPLLAGAGLAHGFGQLDSKGPADVIRPVQQHGTEVATVRGVGDTDPGHAQTDQQGDSVDSPDLANSDFFALDNGYSDSHFAHGLCEYREEPCQCYEPIVLG